MNANINDKFIDDSDILFLIKFGKKTHLQDILNNKLRFAPSQQYIEQEQKLYDKGQGDLLEGKMKIHSVSMKANTQTGEVYHYNQPADVTVSIADVNNMPILCFFTGTLKDCSSYISRKKYTINLSDDVKNTLIHDFHNPDSALIIPNPQNFINAVKKQLHAEASTVRYYDYSKNNLEQYLFLTSDNPNNSEKKLTMNWDRGYKHLLCKDVSFINQQEYRFIILNELITEPKKYDFNFDDNYKLVSTQDLFSGLEIAFQ